MLLVRFQITSSNYLQPPNAMQFRILIFLLLSGQTQMLCAQIGSDFLPIQVGYRWGIINTNGDTILTPKYDFIGLFDKFDYAPVRLNHKMGLINPKGKWIVNPQFEIIEPLTAKWILVGHDDHQKGVQNKDGKFIILPDYQEVTIVQDQFFQVKKAGKYGLFTFEGIEILPPNFEQISFRYINNIVFFQVQQNQKFGLFSANGTQILTSHYLDLKLVTKNTILSQNQHKKWEIWEAQTGTKIIPEVWTTFEQIHTDFIVLQNQVISDKKALYSLITNTLITNLVYDDFIFLEDSSTYIITQKGEKFGLISKTGRLILEPKYDEFATIGQGLISYKKDGIWGVMNQEGKKLFAPTFHEVMPFPNGSPVTKVRLSRSYGLLNRMGKLLTRVNYRKIEVYQNKAKCYLPNQITVVDFDTHGNWTDSITFHNYKTLHITGQLSSEMPRIFRDSVRSLTVRQRQNTTPSTGWQARMDRTYFFADANGQAVRNQNIIFYDAYREDTIRSFSVAWHQKTKQSYIINQSGIVKKSLPIYDIHLADWQQGTHARAIIDNLLNPTGKIQPITATGYGMYALVTNQGNLISTLPVKNTSNESTKPVRYQRITFIDDFFEDLAPVNLNGKLKTLISENESKRDSVFDLESDAVFFPDTKMRVFGGSWGFINRKGELIIQPNYEFVRRFRHGKAIVKQNGKWGVIDKNEKVIIPIKYDFIDYLPESDERFFILTADSRRFGYVDANGRILLEADFENVGKFSQNIVRIQKNKKWGFQNLETNYQIDFQYVKAKDFHENLAGVAVFTPENHLLWGFIDTLGNWVIEPKYSMVGNFRNGRASVKIGSKYGFIDSTGKIVIKPDYKEVSDFQNEVAIVRKKYNYGIINLQGKKLTRFRYKKINTFNEQGIAIAQKPNMRLGLLQRNGNKLSKFHYAKIGLFRENLINVKRFHRNIYKRKSGFLNLLGEEVIAPKFHHAGNFENGLAPAQLTTNGKWGFINTSGEFVIAPKYAVASDFQDNRALVSEKFRTKLMVIDSEGKPVFGTENYISASKFYDNRLILKGKDHRYFVVDKSGHKIHRANFEGIKNYHENRTFVLQNEKWAVMDKNGFRLTDFRFDEAEHFDNQVAKVSVRSLYGIADENGNEILPLHFEVIKLIKDGIFSIQKGDRIGYFRADGTWLWELQK